MLSYLNRRYSTKQYRKPHHKRIQTTSLPSDFSDPLLTTKSLVADPDDLGEDSFSFEFLPVGVERLMTERLWNPLIFLPQSQFGGHSLLFGSTGVRFSIKCPFDKWPIFDPRWTSSEQWISIGWENPACGGPWCKFNCGCTWPNGGRGPNGPHNSCSLCHWGEWCWSLGKSRDGPHERPSPNDEGLAWVALKDPFDRSSQSSSFHACSSMPFWKHS